MTRYIESPDGESAIVADPERPRLAMPVMFVTRIADVNGPTLDEVSKGERVGWMDPDQFRSEGGV